MGKTLCWKCKKAVNGCCWSKRFIPVPGWKAESTYISNRSMVDGKIVNNKIKSYNVITCPLFEHDGKTQPTLEEIAKELGVSLRTIQRRRVQFKQEYIRRKEWEAKNG